MRWLVTDRKKDRDYRPGEGASEQSGVGPGPRRGEGGGKGAKGRVNRGFQGHLVILPCSLDPVPDQLSACDDWLFTTRLLL